jgi:hypothetical protein
MNNNIILLVGHTRNLDLCADSIIKNLCIPNDAKVIGFTYDHIGFWPTDDYSKDINIKSLWEDSFKDYLLNLYIKKYSPEEMHQDNQLSNLLKNNNEHAPTNHNISMWRTRSQALSIVPNNTKLILSRPDLQWLEEMKIPDSGLDVIGQSGIFDDNYFAGSLEDMSILKNIYFQYYNICNKYNISADTHTVLEHYLKNECNNLNLLNPNYSRYLILNSQSGKYRTN